ncbi:dTDP-glucose 4,6-dehydratase [Hyunsoonleella ulvae]|uniref:dTDP-glucose 4,6-dehydratase n=1 Tax=Hyunsoonleella ulvae TaxID=2799948 RepID=UPI0019398C2B|nr:dTDP-glucose 4,6-dehydratase [Hyunsoonleella ulvae]
MTILITGGAGFIGSNFIKYYLDKYPAVQVLNIDKLTYAGNLNNLNEVAKNPRYQFVHGDICNKDLINQLFEEYDFKGVINFAAESHVDNSINNPSDFIHTNITGTFNLLNTARNYWMHSVSKTKKQHKNSRFHHISTDEVYGSLGKKGLFTEETPYAPSSPYSASKASSDFLVRSYFKTYNMNVVTTNCSNNYGPRQHDEKLIPTVIKKALNGEKIPIYGDGENVRDWLYVEDHCSGIDLVFNKGISGETYNIGGSNEYSNIYIASMICEILDKIVPERTSYKDQISFVKDRLGHDFRYAIDESKIKNQLGWEPKENFQTGLEKTINWYIKKYKS